MIFIAIGDIIVWFSLGFSLVGIIIGIINLILHYFEQKRHKIIIEKFQTKKRLFKKWYEYTKDIIDRMVIVNRNVASTYMSFDYRLRKKGGTVFESQDIQEMRFNRYIGVYDEIVYLCGLKPENHEVDENDEEIPIRKEFLNDSIVFPNDMLPRDDQGIVDEQKVMNDWIDQVIILAEENGIKEKYLINKNKKFIIFGA